jgi:hypothetical protein
MSHLMSLSGVKRTSPFAAHMSAFDPKRTSNLQSTVGPFQFMVFNLLRAPVGPRVRQAMRRREFIKMDYSGGLCLAARGNGTSANVSADHQPHKLLKRFRVLVAQEHDL